MLRDVVTKTIKLLDKHQRINGVWISVLLFIQSLLDLFSVASFLPIIFIILNPDSIQTNQYINRLYSLFAFNDYSSFVIWSCIVVAILVLVKNLISLMISQVKARYVFNVGKTLSNNAIERYLNISYAEFSKANFSIEINRILNHPITFANHIVLPMANLISELFVSLLIIVCVSVFDWKIGGVTILILLPLTLFYLSIRARIKANGIVLKEKYPEALKYAQQAVEGLVEIQASGKKDFFKNRFQKINADLIQAFSKEHVIQNGGVRLTEMIAASIICLVIIYTALFQKNFQTTIFALSIYAAASLRIIPSINRIFHSLLQLRTYGPILADLESLKVSNNKMVSPETRTIIFKNTIELNGISMGFESRRNLLNNLSMKIYKGDKIAIAGKSGEGKTTLLLLLLGFYQNFDGTILVDGEKSTPDCLRSIAGYVSQNPYIIDGTVAENIAFGVMKNDIDFQKLTGIVNTLGLSEMISGLPAGLNTNIGEKGVRISGGQRQRIAIARALYAEAKILLLDEILNHLNREAEYEIFSLLNSLSEQGKTIIIVTHKLPHYNFFNTIYELEKGSLKEVTHELVK
jgi:ABC-type multidrug transport system fused ATPase/permease subunit